MGDTGYAPLTKLLGALPPLPLRHGSLLERGAAFLGPADGGQDDPAFSRRVTGGVEYLSVLFSNVSPARLSLRAFRQLMAGREAAHDLASRHCRHGALLPAGDDSFSLAGKSRRRSGPMRCCQYCCFRLDFRFSSFPPARRFCKNGFPAPAMQTLTILISFMPPAMPAACSACLRIHYCLSRG